MSANLSYEAHELSLFLENDRQLYEGQQKSIEKNLITKMAKGEYNSALAVKLWRYLVEAGAKKYTQMHCGRDCVWSRQFPPSVRKEVAELFAKSFEVEAKLGNYNHLLPKKCQTKEAAHARKGGGGADYAMAKPYYAAGVGGGGGRIMNALSDLKRNVIGGPGGYAARSRVLLASVPNGRSVSWDKAQNLLLDAVAAGSLTTEDAISSVEASLQNGSVTEDQFRSFGKRLAHVKNRGGGGASARLRPVTASMKRRSR